MSNDTEVFREFILKLQQEENRPGALNGLKNLLLFKPHGEASITIRNVGLSRIIHCLNVADKTQVDLTCEVLKICFEKFSIGEIVRNYTGHIMYLLRHEKSCVRSLAVEEIYKTVTTDANLLPITDYKDVFVAVSQLISDTDVGIANKSVLITSNLPIEAYPKILEEMKIVLEYSTSSKCNAYEVISNISCKSLEHLQLCVDNGYINHMLNELNTDDFLYQLNILELLTRIAVVPHGISHFVINGVLQNVSELIRDLRTHPFYGLLIPGYMKFFGSIAHHYPREIFEQYPVFLDYLFEGLESSDQSILLVALDTLGFIGITIEGKLCLAAVGSKYTQAVEIVGQKARNSVTDLKIRSLNCLSNLIGVDKDPNKPKTGPVDHRVTLMTREWFRSICNRPMDMLLDNCKNPFPDVKMASFELLDAICQHQWGEEMVARTAGFIEYLLDRTVDITKESKESKYDIIKRLSQSVAFDENTINSLRTYVVQGPFHCDAITEVAMDEMN